ncbi:putative E3 ubiquitin-protein ligase XERICO [Iris pallida]|uniref:E3 ubiquitin-protein ligase XERICO n=1 Tax=Iris pallida TaxID=29817 RepID=A0AAX6EYW2_IRIPA|nr:putative E3 ubiquitin-protein ligase XERICO [Iris pallida]
MGLSSLPSPSEGVLTVVLVNTALSVSILKQILRSLLASCNWKPSSLLPHPDRPAEPTLADRFRSRLTPVRYRPTGRPGCAQHAPDCRVCLCRFEPESLVSRLPCGHLFHRGCVETWLDYNHAATCPLCRTRMLPDELDPEPDPVWF